MQLTVDKIAKIMNLSVDQVLTACQEAEIVYTDERFFSEQEIERLRTVIFRYYQSKQSSNQSFDSGLVHLTPVSKMETLVLEKKIMIDTCSLMHERCEDVIGQLLTHLKKYRKKMIIPVRVIDELKKLQLSSDDSDKRHAANNGMRLCRELLDNGCLSVRGSDKDNFADNVFFVTISNYRYYHRMVLITQDRPLTYDVLQLNTFQSGGECHPVEVMHITGDGELCLSEMPDI